MCGGTASAGSQSGPEPGLSPRVRGNRLPEGVHAVGRGSIPACAGEPPQWGRTPPRAGVYPRVCGGTPSVPHVGVVIRGLSPRVRGNRRRCGRTCPGRRSIPACAGEPLPLPLGNVSPRVYPRVCGGTGKRGCEYMMSPGLSPRVRGNHVPGRMAVGGNRSIPACAGEPSGLRRACLSGSVYPRVCGGTFLIMLWLIIYAGLSPRVRGNLHRPLWRGLSAGSIPACAGEPTSSPANGLSWTVYPRVCGGTLWLIIYALAMAGLSPRVRGNLYQARRGSRTSRSIPACAGEPPDVHAASRHSGVYPRVCGGTSARSGTGGSSAGLSPRVRGNLDAEAYWRMRNGSIPACAGEPPHANASGLRPWVYPRVCGGTVPFLAFGIRRAGLSPRVRGNPDPYRRGQRPAGSIPACAGEPRGVGVHVIDGRVYPRVCGGTAASAAGERLSTGLSPRVRGNQRESTTSFGTTGLSPRVRGNLPTWSGTRPASGSIPACAGEPPS